jgi:hypothetical protein
MSKTPLNSELEVEITDLHPRAERLITDANQSHLLNSPTQKHDNAHVKAIIDDDDTSLAGELADLDELKQILRSALHDTNFMLGGRNAYSE